MHRRVLRFWGYSHPLYALGKRVNFISVSTINWIHRSSSFNMNVVEKSSRFLYITVLKQTSSSPVVIKDLRCFYIDELLNHERPSFCTSLQLVLEKLKKLYFLLVGPKSVIAFFQIFWIKQFLCSHTEVQWEMFLLICFEKDIAIVVYCSSLLTTGTKFCEISGQPWFIQAITPTFTSWSFGGACIRVWYSTLDLDCHQKFKTFCASTLIVMWIDSLRLFSIRTYKRDNKTKIHICCLRL